MVVLNDDFVRITVLESKRHPPAPVHRHGPSSPPVAGQRVEPNGLKRPKRGERRRGIKRIKQHQRSLVIKAAKTSQPPALEQSATLTVSE